MKQSELIKEQEQQIKDLKTQLEIAELRVKNLELRSDINIETKEETKEEEKENLEKNIKVCYFNYKN